MDYKQKYLKYKEKYIEFKKILHGGALILPWHPMKSNQLYISAVIDPASYLGGELIQRLKALQLPIIELHISILEILVPETRQNYGGPGYPADNPIDLYIKTNLNTLKDRIKDIYNLTLGESIAYSKMDNYDCYGNFFVRKYDDINFIKYIQTNFRNFKIGIIHELLNNSSLNTNFSNIHRPLIKLNSSSDSKKVPIITKEFTHYYQKGLDNYLSGPVPPAKNGQYTSLFAISEYYDTTDIDVNGGVFGWIPHVSITNDVLRCLDKIKFKEDFKSKAINALSYLPLWASQINKQRPDDPTKRMNGSILKLKITYAGQTVEVNL